MESDWNPPLELSIEETQVLKLCKQQKFWHFLRLHRTEILDEEVRVALHAMYDLGPRGGRPPESPERLVLAMLLQVAFGVPDHEVPTLTAVDRRWQMVLDCMGASEPAFSQGTVFAFRERARRSGLVLLLLDKTVALARTTKGFDPKRLRALIDSSPLVGAGRVEDTFNLLGRAIAELVAVIAAERGVDADALSSELAISVTGASSVKAALDVDWRKPEARTKALTMLVEQFERIRKWLDDNVPTAQQVEPPLSEHIATVERIIAQDTEPDPEPGPGGETRHRIRKGTQPDRLISLSDKEMRHGRKSKTKTFNGYKRHVVVDADVRGLIVGVEVLPANKQEHEALEPLLDGLGERLQVVELHVDRGYLASPRIGQLRGAGVTIVTKPPTPRRGEHYSKEDFTLDFVDMKVTCPAGATTRFEVGKVASFSRAACGPCALKCNCTKRPRRELNVHKDEKWFREMDAELSTPDGRALRRKRIPVEHALAHVGAIQGNRSRFKGLEKNRFALQRAALVNNYFLLDRLAAAA